MMKQQWLLMWPTQGGGSLSANQNQLGLQANTFSLTMLAATILTASTVECVAHLTSDEEIEPAWSMFCSLKLADVFPSPN